MEKRLHILFLCGWYPSKVLHKNGDFIQRHAEAVALKHKVSVLHIVSDKNCNQKIKITSQQINNVETHIAYLKTTSNIFKKVLRFWKGYHLLLKEISDFDIVHVNKLYPFGIFALHIKRTKKIPYLVSEHWTGYHFTKQKPLGWIEKFISKRIAKKASNICPVTNNLKKSMILSGLNGSYKIVPNVVNTSLFKPKETANNTFSLIHISGLQDAHKNISGMLRVAKRLENKIENFEWKFVGGKQTEFQKLISSLNFKKSNIHFTEHINHHKIPNYLNNADVFVLFSNYENLPCVILEAFSCGIPVIATNVGGIQEFFPSDFGHLIEKGNKDQLLEKIIELYKNPIDRKSEMHNYAINNFSPKKICDDFTDLYLNALAN